MLRAMHMHQPYAWTSTALEQYQKRLQGCWSSSEWFRGGQSGMSCMGEVVWQKTHVRSTKSFSACPLSVVLSAHPIQALLSPSFSSSPLSNSPGFSHGDTFLCASPQYFRLEVRLFLLDVHILIRNADTST